MALQHTPGPWIIRGETGIDSDAEGIFPAFAGAPIGGGWPFFIRQDREFKTGESPIWIAHGIQGDADAKLIGAAPDLLKAASDALMWVEHWQRDVAANIKPTEGSLSDFAAELRAVIAKAGF